jgi:hypothetical protein
VFAFRIAFSFLLPGVFDTLVRLFSDRTTLSAEFFPKPFHRPLGTAHFIRRFFEREIVAPDVHDHLRALVEFVHQREELVKQTHQFFGTRMMISSGLGSLETRIEGRIRFTFPINVTARRVLPPKFMLKLLECDGAENLPETVVALAAKTLPSRQRDHTAKRPLHDVFGVQSAPDLSRQPPPHEPDERRTVTPHNFRPSLRIVPFQKFDDLFVTWVRHDRIAFSHTPAVPTYSEKNFGPSFRKNAFI